MLNRSFTLNSLPTSRDICHTIRLGDSDFDRDLEIGGPSTPGVQQGHHCSGSKTCCRYRRRFFDYRQPDGRQSDSSKSLSISSLQETMGHMLWLKPKIV